MKLNWTKSQKDGHTIYRLPLENQQESAYKVTLEVRVPDGFEKIELPNTTSWLEALRSGKYLQSPGLLFSNATAKRPEGYCCLGVLVHCTMPTLQVSKGDGFILTNKELSPEDVKYSCTPRPSWVLAGSLRPIVLGTPEELAALVKARPEETKLIEDYGRILNNTGVLPERIIILAHVNEGQEESENTIENREYRSLAQLNDDMAGGAQITFPIIADIIELVYADPKENKGDP